MTIEDHPDYTLSYESSQDAKDRVFEIMLKHFKALDAFDGDSLGGGNDEVYIEAPDIMIDVAENGFKFVKEYKE